MSQTVVNELGKVTTKHNMQGNLGDASSGSVEDGNNNNDTEAISASWGSKPNSQQMTFSNSVLPLAGPDA